MKKAYNMINTMAPLWFAYPYIGRYSIGWRMGDGEGYVSEFSDWYSNLTIEEQEHYQRMFPTPKGWQGWYDEEQADQDIYDDDGYLLWKKDGELEYSLERVQGSFRKCEKMEYIFFWGHQPSDDGSITKTCFSQWWKSDFTVETQRYCCMEQYMMAEKARLFEDDGALEKIMSSNNPKQIKGLGRTVKKFDEEVWEKKRSTIILNGNYAKFFQNEDLKQYLLKTKDAVLVEASPYDRIWGIGMSVNDENINNPLAWRGQNLLGFALMEVRDELVRVCRNEGELNLQKNCIE